MAAVSVLAISLIGWLVRSNAWALITLFLSLIIGQSLRAQVPGQGGGLLFSDIATILVLLSAYVRWLRHPTHIPWFIRLITILICLFLAWSIWGLALHVHQLGLGTIAIALAYWLRLGSHFLLLPTLLWLLRSPPLHRLTQYLLISTVCIIILLGLIQWWWLPDLHFLRNQGWDPHQGRLVSTWLDPNFIGGFFIITAWPVLTLCYQWLKRRKPTMAVLGTVLVALLYGVALSLTRSRTSLGSFVLAFILVSPLLSITMFRSIASFFPKTRPKEFTTAIWIMIASLSLWLIVGVSAASLVLGDRLQGFYTHDPTVTLRLAALHQMWPSAVQYFFTGLGYNAYQVAAQQASLIDSFTIHSRSGADNSFLTLLITTGLPGLILFIIPWAVVWQICLRRWLQNHDVLALTAAFSLVAWSLHSQFVNSLLYSHLVITMIIIVSLAVTDPTPDAV